MRLFGVIACIALGACVSSERAADSTALTTVDSITSMPPAVVSQPAPDSVAPSGTKTTAPGVSKPPATPARTTKRSEGVGRDSAGIIDPKSIRRLPVDTPARSSVGRDSVMTIRPKRLPVDTLEIGR